MAHSSLKNQRLYKVRIWWTRNTLMRNWRYNFEVKEVVTRTLMSSHKKCTVTAGMGSLSFQPAGPCPVVWLTIVIVGRWRHDTNQSDDDVHDDNDSKWRQRHYIDCSTSNLDYRCHTVIQWSAPCVRQFHGITSAAPVQVKSPRDRLHDGTIYSHRLREWIPPFTGTLHGSAISPHLTTE